jgi:hypothetical protein
MMMLKGPSNEHHACQLKLLSIRIDILRQGLFATITAQPILRTVPLPPLIYRDTSLIHSPIELLRCIPCVRCRGGAQISSLAHGQQPDEFLGEGGEVNNPRRRKEHL